MWTLADFLSTFFHLFMQIIYSKYYLMQHVLKYSNNKILKENMQILHKINYIVFGL